MRHKIIVDLFCIIRYFSFLLLFTLQLLVCADDDTLSKPNVWHIKSYLRQMEEVSEVKFTKPQIKALFAALKTTSYKPLSTQDKKTHYKIYNTNGCRARLVRDWEKNTGMTWPTYAVVIKGKKTLFSCHYHHIIPQNITGPHVWWNGFPIPPELHQSVVHGKGSFLNKILRKCL